MSDRSDLMETALRLQECQRLMIADRFVAIRILLDKTTDLVAEYQDQDNERLVKITDIKVPSEPSDVF